MTGISNRRGFLTTMIGACADRSGDLRVGADRHQ